jgi:hypothetical protein
MLLHEKRPNLISRCGSTTLVWGGGDRTERRRPGSRSRAASGGFLLPWPTRLTSEKFHVKPAGQLPHDVRIEGCPPTRSSNVFGIPNSESRLRRAPVRETSMGGGRHKGELSKGSIDRGCASDRSAREPSDWPQLCDHPLLHRSREADTLPARARVRSRRRVLQRLLLRRKGARRPIPCALRRRDY